MVRLTGILTKYMPQWFHRGIVDFTDDKRFFRKMKLLELTQEYGKRNRNCPRLAINYFERSLRLQKRRRKLKAMWFKDLYSQRIFAALEEHRFPYKYLMGILPQIGVELDRKMLAHLALWEPRTFASLVDICKAKVVESPTGEPDAELEMPPGVITRKLL